MEVFPDGKFYLTQRTSVDPLPQIRVTRAAGGCLPESALFRNWVIRVGEGVRVQTMASQATNIRCYQGIEIETAGQGSGIAW